MALKWHDAEFNLVLHSPHGATGKYLATLGALIETAAKNECPVKTGRLRSSISHRVEEVGGELCAVIGSNVSYAIFVHEGTRYMAARPFLVNGMHSVLGH